ncbi:MAG: ABC transporter ATP-binding protein [Eubacterium sp.]|nr:ABC transporter ATP-binding protein [Eubacterium sp.]
MVKVNGIKKSFARNSVLKGVTFDIEEGSIYGLIGKNGAGKTTLMNIMAGLLKADGGACSFGGVGKKVGYLPDLPAFYDYLTTDEYLDFLLVNKNPGRRNELLKQVGLSDKMKIKTLSRGMKQRLGIAGVLVNDPDVILLDEPTSALDPSGRNDVKDILFDLRSKGKTIMLSTHILADMDSICDKAGFLSGGVIAKEVDVAATRNSAEEMIVTFASEPDLEKLYSYVQKIFVIDPVTIRIVMDKEDKLVSQQHILQGLSSLGQEITFISTAVNSLDGIFREVCL